MAQIDAVTLPRVAKRRHAGSTDHLVDLRLQARADKENNRHHDCIGYGPRAQPTGDKSSREPSVYSEQCEGYEAGRHDAHQQSEGDLPFQFRGHAMTL